MKGPTATLEPATQSIDKNAAATLTVSGTDDGLPANYRTGKPAGLRVVWRKYRGPGDVTFSSVIERLVDGKATTTAHFSKPGDYVIQAMVHDGSMGVGTYCCWVNKEVNVTVRP